MDTKVLRILFEDEYLIAVEKPAGIHTAPLQPGESGTLLSLVMERYPEVAGLPGVKRVEPGLLHRLDRETSGIVIVARTEPSFRALREQFDSDRVSKEYSAVCAYLVEASGEDRSLRIESRFAACGPGNKMVRVVLPAERNRRFAREASPDTYTTKAKVVSRSGNFVLVRAHITRGFRHQVRLHLAFLGFPIIGDLLYGTPVSPGFPERMYLHASKIELVHPGSGKPLIIKSPLPPEFATVKIFKKVLDKR